MELVIKIAGEAGMGANVTGRTLGKTFTRGGLFVVGYPEYPSLVRGGHNVYQVRISDEEIHSPVKNADIVIALDRNGVLFHKDKIKNEGVVIYDSSINTNDISIRKDIHLISMPFSELVAKAGGDIRMKNTLALGAALALVDYPIEIPEEVIKDEFSRKGKEVVEKNLSVLRSGYEFIKNLNISFNLPKIKPISKKRKIFIGGNEAAGLGAIKAGLKFYSAYPMTPASTLLHFFAAKEFDYNLIVKHTEDEISAIQYAVGASYAGVRSMVGTSGGGFSLMVETLGMAALAETPLVVYIAQRVGPSTGMPTWTEQGDLRFAMHASQGDFLRVILAPGDVNESFELTAKAFNLAEKYQIPVIILNDKFNAETHFSTDGFPKVKIERGKIAKDLPKLNEGERFLRYKITKDGISPRTLPGEPNGMHVATSYEHDESSFSSEDFKMRTQQVDKRAKKLKSLLKDMELPKTYGEGEISLIVWGSQKLPALDALKYLKKKGIKVKLISFTYIFPLDWEKIRRILENKTTIILENNSSAQFASVLKEYIGFIPDYTVLKYDGRPFFPEEIADAIEKIISGKAGEKLVYVDDDYEYYNPARYR